MSEILDLAAQLHHPPEHVAMLYCAELTRLARMAVVADYLPVLTAKRVRSLLRSGHGG
ncbi:DUF3562 domain-containing protein [Massilia horti]|uniref:DUF3562 domain-containing protein n=1 Tax=Massilia horti TaxID=2562153 RepID=UPI00351D9FC4